MTNAIRYQPANVKLRGLVRALELERGRRVKVYGTSLPSGFSCPGALDCLSKADQYTGKITDGSEMEFRCFMASIEAYSNSLRALVWNNFSILRRAKTREAMVEALDAGFPADADAVRPGIGGDFFNYNHFAAWMDVARRHPNVLVYCYTKSINYWVDFMEREEIPHNMEINGSEGGRYDSLLTEYGLKTAKVVFHPAEAVALGLEVDHNEMHAIRPGPSFALLIHGTQSKGSDAAAAIKQLKLEGIEYAYRGKP